jgi:ribosomal protein L11 methylase PrmA
MPPGHNVQRALRAATRNGDRVLDVGTGSGPLSFAGPAGGTVEASAVDPAYLAIWGLGVVLPVDRRR